MITGILIVNNTSVTLDGADGNGSTQARHPGNGELSRLEWKVASGIVAFLVIVVNSLVIALFLSKAKLRKSTTNKILMSLVTSDLVTGLVFAIHFVVSITPTLANAHTPQTIGFRIFLDILTSWLQLVTMGNLSLIIFERYITLIYPYKLDIFLTKKRIRMAIHSIWIVPFFVPCIQLAWVYRFMTADHASITPSEQAWTAHADSVFSAVTIFLFVLLPMAAFFVIFVRMFREIQKFPSLELFNKKKEEKRVLKIFAVMYSLFVIFSLPYFLVRLLMDLEQAGHYQVSITTSLLVIFLKSVPPLINPFVYVLNKPDFRRELQRRRDILTNVLDRHTRFSSFMTMTRRPSNDPSLNKCATNNDNNNNNNNGGTGRHSTTYSDSTAFHSASSSSSQNSSSNDGTENSFGILIVKTKAIFVGGTKQCENKERFL